MFWRKVLGYSNNLKLRVFDRRKNKINLIYIFKIYHLQDTLVESDTTLQSLIITISNLGSSPVLLTLLAVLLQMVSFVTTN